MTQLATGARPARCAGPTWSTFMAGSWIAFAVLAAWYPEVLERLWSWLQGLALAWEVVMWIVMLPWALGLAVWESGWDGWLRVALVALVALAWTAVSVPRTQA